ncbi:CmcI family methyltransferase [Gemmobacter lanyuensis]
MNGQKYKGRTMLLSPFDQFNYMSLIETLRPGTIFEIGTYEGGRALWMADQLRAFDIEGRIVSVDIAPPKGIADPKVDVIYGNALDLGEVLTADFLSALPRPWLVIEDAAHTEPMCLAVLEFFDAHLQPGDRIVVEDGNTGSLIGQPETSAPTWPFKPSCRAEGPIIDWIPTHATDMAIILPPVPMAGLFGRDPPQCLAAFQRGARRKGSFLNPREAMSGKETGFRSSNMSV